jgi:hypothetical protein
LTAKVSSELSFFRNFISVFSLLISQSILLVIKLKFKHLNLLFLFREKNQGKNLVLDLFTVYYNPHTIPHGYYGYTEQ